MPPSSNAVVRAACAAGVAFALAFAREARAVEPPVREPGGREDLAASLLHRPHTIAELEAGIIALPTAPISVANQGGSTPFGTFGKGDATIQTGMHLLYRANESWAIGAGVLFAPKPTSDDQYRAIGGPAAIPRTHSRSYLLLGAEFRYFFEFLRWRWFEAWGGGTVGGVIVADRFETKAGDEVPAILGTREVTIRSEGLMGGLQLGANYMLSENWVIGLTGKAALWFLPGARPPGQDPRCSPIGDCPTLSGTVQAYDIGVTVGYRIPL